MIAVGSTASRRDVLKGASSLGLELGFQVGGCSPERPSANSPQVVNAWLRIATDGAATIYVNATELGQGSQSGMAQVISEEAGLDWAQVHIEQAPIEPMFFNGDTYYTGGSGAIADQWDHLRNVGAAARWMLRQAAAERWDVPVEQCEADAGAVRHPASGRTLSYGALATRAGQLAPPAGPPLTPRGKWQLIGKPVKRLDIPLKVDGRAIYGVDVKLPGMLIAAVAQCPIYGGRLESLDEPAAMAVKGVRKVVHLPAWRDELYVNMPLQETLAVLADGYWPATQGLAKLSPRWVPDETPFETDALYAQLRQDVRHDAIEAGDKTIEFFRKGSEPGDQKSRVARAFADAARTVDAEYEVPFIAHLTMEPMSAAARWQGRELEVWSGTQAQSDMKAVMNRRFGIAPEKVKVHTTFAGGGFGRRFYADAQIQAAALAKEADAPVKVIWSRAEDIQHDMYRPPAVALFRAAIGTSGQVEAVETRQARICGMRFDVRYAELKYDWPAFVGAATIRPQPVSFGAWRSVEHGPQAFFIESFVDELAHAVSEDPIAYRKQLLKKDSRALRLLDVLAEKSGWAKPKASGTGRGVAFMPGNDSLAAEVVEVAHVNGALKVLRVVCAFDCGTVVNPDNVRAQGESAILYGLSAALNGEITFKSGRVQEANFDSYPVVGLAQAPQIEVHLLESPEAKVGGAGEPMLPPLAPALANAVFDLTGHRIRRLPLSPLLGKTAGRA